MKQLLNRTYVDPETGAPAPDRTQAYRAYRKARGDRAAFVDLFTITLATLGPPDLANGGLAAPMTLRWATSSYDVVFEGIFYAGAGAGGTWGTARMPGPRIRRKGIETAIGTDVSELELEIGLDATRRTTSGPADRLPPADGLATTPRFGLGEALAAGIFDTAAVELRRLVLPDHPRYPFGPTSLANRGDWGPGDLSLGAVHMFQGWMSGDCDVTRSHVTLKVKTQMEQCALQMPWRILQARCRWPLYGKGCGISRTGRSPLDTAPFFLPGYPFQVLGTIVAVETPTRLVVDVTAGNAQIEGAAPGFEFFPARWFRNGTLQFTADLLCGFTARVTESATLDPVWQTRVTLMNALPRLPQVGMAVCLQAGCDKIVLVRDQATGAVTDGTCGAKFGNTARADCEPIVPVPDSAY